MLTLPIAAAYLRWAAADRRSSGLGQSEASRHIERAHATETKHGACLMRDRPDPTFARQDEPLSFADRARPIVIFIGAIWVVFVLDLVLPLEQLGLVPRRFSGLAGIVTMPFLHGSLGHLLSNTVPLIVLLGLMVLSRPRPWSTMILLTLLSGAALWLLGRPALHIGASGLIYALMGFLLAAGALERRLLPAAVALFVGLTYGLSIIGGILPWQAGVSWEGHLLGLFAGAALAWTRFGPRRTA